MATSNDALIDEQAYAVNSEFERLLRKVHKPKKGVYKATYAFEDEEGDEHTGKIRVPFIPAPKTAAELSLSLDAVVLSAQAAAGAGEILSSGLVIEQHQAYLETFLAVSASILGVDNLRLEHQLALDTMRQRNAIETTLGLLEMDIELHGDDIDPDIEYDPDDDDYNEDYWDACDAYDVVEAKLAQKSEEIIDYGRTVLQQVAKGGW